MSINNITSEPLKVRNWNNPEKPETRVNYALSIIEDNHWIEIGCKINQDGTTETTEHYVGRFPEL